MSKIPNFPIPLPPPPPPFRRQSNKKCRCKKKILYLIGGSLSGISMLGIVNLKVLIKQAKLVLEGSSLSVTQTSKKPI